MPLMWGDVMKVFALLTYLTAIICIISASNLVISSASAESGDDTEVRYYYIGAIGDDLAVQMELIVGSDDVTGIYFYDKNGIPLELSGDVNHSDSTFSLVEQDDKGEKTGTFKGRFVQGEGGSADTIEGEWSKANGLATLPFKLKKVADFVFSSVRQGTMIDSSYSVPFFLSGLSAYTGISSELEQEMVSKQNKFLKEAREFFLTQTSVAGWQQTINYTIDYYSAELVSLSGEVFSYTGGAHGNTFFVSSTYWIKDGKAVRLKLADFFLPNAAYMKVLSDYCINDLREKGAQWVVSGELKEFKEEDLRVFAVSPRGIMFAFAPYAVGSYAEGPYFVEIDYDELDGVLNPEGPLKKFISQKSGVPGKH